MNELVEICRQLEVLFLNDLVNLVGSNLELITKLLDLGLLDSDTVLLLLELLLSLLDLFEALSKLQLFGRLFVVQILFARLNFFVEVEELVAFGLERLVVALAGLHVHAEQVVNETEHLQEHGESVLAHESKLYGHVE